MKLLIGAGILFSLPAFILAQNQPRPEFEVVSIKASPPPPPGGGITVGCRGGPGTDDPGMFRCTNISLSNLITMAYAIAHYQLSGPDWMTGSRFEIAARLPEAATKDDFKLMLQNTLATRFKLTVHHESRDMPRYDLVVAKGGPKLQPSADQPPQSAQRQDTGPPGPPKRDAEGYPILNSGRGGMAIMNGKARMFNPKITLDQFAMQLGFQLGKPVTNATGLEGNYAIGIYWDARSMRAAPPPGQDGSGAPVAQDPDGPTLEQAVQQQLGLKLEAKKGPADILVVDHLEKIPVEN